MITEKQWYEHDGFRQELAGLLNNRTLLIALEIVKEKGLRSTQPVGNASLTEWFALMGAKKDGYLEALLNLQSLAELPPRAPTEQKAWTSNQQAAGKTKPDTDSKR